ncbi:condensation domain-containing protein [Actinokineospora guangxiensis]|uniref:Condensation domain-containing protein n=1 Tax=Actinokineospora guangxiensis TaxID=1490288 RepID=A0ABW0EK66_9PSEU
MSVSSGPMNFGQLSVWRDVEEFPAEKAYQANMVRVVPLDGVATATVRAVVERLRARHAALRTVYDFADPAAPRQHVRPADSAGLVFREVGPRDGEDAEAAAARIADEMEHESFDLTTDESLRTAIVVVDGEGTHGVFALHHIAADMWSLDLLRGEVDALLRGDEPAGDAPSPLDLALAQHSERWAPRREAAARHLREAFTAAAQAAVPGIALAEAATARANLRSRVAGPTAEAKAAALGISVPSLVLAAYCREAHRISGAEHVLINTMTTNRLHPGTATLVSSLNQWARVISHRGADDFTAMAASLHWSSMRSFRYGCYDVDTEARIRAEVEAGTGPIHPEFHFNFVDSPAPADPPDADDELSETKVSALPATYVGGPGFYLVATSGGDFHLTARTRWAGFTDADMAAFLRAVHENLI